jgi:hypothetical protein
LKPGRNEDRRGGKIGEDVGDDFVGQAKEGIKGGSGVGK